MIIEDVGLGIGIKVLTFLFIEEKSKKSDCFGKIIIDELDFLSE
jgi:hypothetical protein